ncbi:pYEATS domain-containing protein [Ralstonia solanacearum]|uniref:pYEATS domain-containing protein n=2 Tax=Ralstonia solanacearum TaxID=305 RepID=UPI00295EA1F6|nr:pYEATS domain-containing protein [Ralstonia solanacearum]
MEIRTRRSTQAFFSEEGTRRYGGDGRAYYQFEVVVMALGAVMERAEKVVFHLEDAWPKELRTKVINDRASRFKMKDLANGTSIVVADVYFLDDDQPLQLNRFIDLRLDGPRV